MQTVPNAVASQISFNEGILRLAAVHDREVVFRYAKSDTAPIETRRFVPETVGVSRGGDTIVIGEDEDREALRSFRLDRIKGDVKLP